MTRIASWCVDKEMQGVKTFTRAMVFCDRHRQATVCSVEALLACDLTDHRDSQCDLKTDDGRTRLWTGTVDPSFDRQVVESLVVYSGNNFLSIANAGELHGFFCCRSPGSSLDN